MYQLLTRHSLTYSFTHSLYIGGQYCQRRRHEQYSVDHVPSTERQQRSTNGEGYAEPLGLARNFDRRQLY